MEITPSVFRATDIANLLLKAISKCHQHHLSQGAHHPEWQLSTTMVKWLHAPNVFLASSQTFATSRKQSLVFPEQRTNGNPKKMFHVSQTMGLRFQTQNQYRQCFNQVILKATP